MTSGSYSRSEICQDHAKMVICWYRSCKDLVLSGQLSLRILLKGQLLRGKSGVEKQSVLISGFWEEETQLN